MFIVADTAPKNKKGAEKMSRYFTTNNMDSLVFYQVPKVLLVGDKYKSMNPNAMKLYIVLIDRIKLSMKNNWKDELGRYYVRLSIEKGSELLGFSDSTFKRAKKELKNYDLLEEKREGMNKTNLLYPLMLEYTKEDIYRINSEVDDLLEETEKSAQRYEESWKGQNELSKRGQKELSEQVNLSHPDRSKRTTINNNIIKNDFNNNENIFVNNLLTRKEEIINNLVLEYMKKGLSKQVCFMVLKEVEQNPDIKNFGGYFRNALENALYKHNIKHGKIDPFEKIKGIAEEKDLPFYNWLEEED